MTDRNGPKGELVSGVPRWLAVALLMALLAAASAGIQPWLFAIAGAFRPPDFSQDLAGAQLLREGVLPYSEFFRDEHARVYGADPRHAYPYLPHPPFAVALALPLVGLSLASAAVAWFTLSIVLLFILAMLLGERWTGSTVRMTASGPPYSIVLPLLALLMLWPPVLYHLEKGQFSLILAVLLLLSARTFADGRWSVCGVCVGAAAAIKVFPVLIGGLLLLRARRSLAVAAGTVTILTATPLLFMGHGAGPAWVQHSARNVEYWQTWPSITYGIHGTLARALVGGPWANPLVHAPFLSDALFVVIATGLVGTAAWVTRESSGADAWTSFSTWSVLLVLLNPLAMPHNAVLLAWPFLETAIRIRRGSHPRLRIAWAAALVLASIPRQALSGLVTLPASPAAGLMVTSLPCLGTLLLFAVACFLAHTDAVRSQRACRWKWHVRSTPARCPLMASPRNGHDVVRRLLVSLVAAGTSAVLANYTQALHTRFQAGVARRHQARVPRHCTGVAATCWAARQRTSNAPTLSPCG